MTVRGHLLAVAAGLAVCGCASAAPSAWAAGGPPAPGWEAYGAFSPADLPPGGNGVLRLYLYDIGAATGDGSGLTVTVRLPESLEAVALYTEGEEPTPETTGCSGTSVVTCQLGEPGPSAGPEVVGIPVHVRVDASVANSTPAFVSVGGGGAADAAETTVPVVFGSGSPAAGFENADLWLSNADGTIDTQAGSHPYALTMMFTTNTIDGPGFERPSGGEIKALNVNLPPGLVGEPSVIPQCQRAVFDNEKAENEPACPRASLIGEDFATVGGFGPIQVGGGVYNLIPPAGVAAEFGLNFRGTHVILDARLRSGGDYGITTHGNVPQEHVDFNTIQFWGVPGEHTGTPPKPFLTLPTSCGAPPTFSVEMLGTWQHSSEQIAPLSFPWHDAQGNPVGMTGCERLTHFEPLFSAVPDTSFSDSPAGLTSVVKLPQNINPEGLATSGLREVTVKLPPGMAINPGQATGLVACQLSQAGLPLEGEDGEEERFDGPASCPNASKVGTAEIATPVLRSRLKGSLYVLQSNPPEVKLLLTASGEGVFVKEIGTVELNEETGQVTAVFKGNPRYPGIADAPLDEFSVSFSGGAQAALITPATCGEYTSTAQFTPWAAPLVEEAFTAGRFVITAGPGGTGSCTGPLPFAPELTAGSTTDQAGAYTSFSMLLQRPDGQQRIKSLQFKVPPGLSGMISKVQTCPEPQANLGDCPAASQIGHTVAGAGAGPYPFFLPQAGAPPAPIYLTGPHDGAPFGLSIVVPVIAGPFNLGTRVIRGAIAVDRKTAQITVTIDSTGPYALPTILKGVPADLRSINAVIDKAGFMFNPTNCSPLAFSGTATGTEGATAPLETHFEVGSCQVLKFKPKFTATARAKTSRQDGASVTFKLTYPNETLASSQALSQENIKRFKIQLPKRLPSRLTTLQKACLAAVFQANPANCPAASVVGRVTAHTPLLPVPVTGPAYFVSYGNEAFPALVMVLQGDGVTVDLESATFIDKHGITTGTLREVPDVPVSSFELSLPAGPHSAFTANRNLCKGRATFATEMLAQDNAVLKQQTPLTVTGCHRKRARHKRRR
jgi:hypothetical protein